jgi:hypothetical protein
MMPLSSQGGHSAIVNIRLLVNGDAIPVAQMGPDYLFIDAPVDHQPGEATVVLNVDQSESRWKVWLPNGISAKSEKVSIAALSGSVHVVDSAGG